ncbi:MAG: hypothetical protein RIE31_08655 [Alphaproteobacteria bacterium]
MSLPRDRQPPRPAFRRGRITAILYLVIALAAGGMFAVAALEWLGLFRLHGRFGDVLLFGVGPAAAFILYGVLHRLAPERFPFG